MIANPTGPYHGTSNLVERQIRNWELTRAQRIEQAVPATRAVEDFVAISRAVGSGGAAAAHRLGQRLGWPVFDQEILHAMAGDDWVRERLYEHLDERDQGWLESMLRGILNGEFRREDYSHRLVEAVLAVARQGHAVFLGRAADLILPRERGLRVRIIAPDEPCVRGYAAQHGLKADDARRAIKRIEHERADFIRNHFGRDAADPTRYDLIVNTERLSVDQAVELIVAGLRVMGVEK